jgi:hypothetical protein
MTWTEIGQILTAIPAILAFIVSLINRNKIQEVHLSVNSRLDELLKTSIAQARIEGRAEGVASVPTEKG